MTETVVLVHAGSKVDECPGMSVGVLLALDADLYAWKPRTLALDASQPGIVRDVPGGPSVQIRPRLTD